MSLPSPPPGRPAGAHRSANNPAADTRAVSSQVEAALGPILERLDAILSRLGDTQSPEPHLTVVDFARQVGRSEYRIRAWIKEKRLKAIKTAGAGPRSKWLIPRTELLRLLGNQVVVG